MKWTTDQERKGYDELEVLRYRADDTIMKLYEKARYYAQIYPSNSYLGHRARAVKDQVLKAIGLMSFESILEREDQIERGE